LVFCGLVFWFLFFWLWVSGELTINRETKVCGVECGCFWVNSGQCTAENLGFSENWSRNKFERRAVPSRVAVKPQLNPCQRFCSDGREEAAQQQRRGSGSRRSVLKMESKRVCATGKAAGGGGEEWKGERVRRTGGVVAMEWQSLYIYIYAHTTNGQPIPWRDEMKTHHHGGPPGARERERARERASESSPLGTERMEPQRRPQSRGGVCLGSRFWDLSISVSKLLLGFLRLRSI